jgi:hypothetical protein
VTAHIAQGGRAALQKLKEGDHGSGYLTVPGNPATDCAAIYAKQMRRLKLVQPEAVEGGAELGGSHAATFTFSGSLKIEPSTHCIKWSSASRRVWKSPL